MKNRKKLIVLIALSILIILVIAMSISIAFMKSIDDGENITEVSLSSCAKIKLNGSNSVNLTNSYPMSRNKGLQTTPYTFTVASYCDSYVGFNLYLAILENNTLDGKYEIIDSEYLYNALNAGVVYLVISLVLCVLIVKYVQMKNDACLTLILSMVFINAIINNGIWGIVMNPFSILLVPALKDYFVERKRLIT